MSEMSEHHHKVNYIELATQNIKATKTFFTKAFGWYCVDYGPEYFAFMDGGIDGGFYQSEKAASVEEGSPLVVIYSEELEETQSHIEEFGGKVIKPIFSFPGGRRFHFREPGGNELAVWSEDPDQLED